MPVKIKDIDRGYRGLFTRALAVSNQKLVAVVGVQGEEAEEEHDQKSGISNARLAGVHEFGAEIQVGGGTVKIPERSFIRATVDAHNAYKNEVRTLAGQVLTGVLPVWRALSVLGEKVASDIKTRIERGIPPPNAPSTIAAKGSSKPLIDTGQLKNAISYDVREDTIGETIAGNR